MPPHIHKKKLMYRYEEANAPIQESKQTHTKKRMQTYEEANTNGHRDVLGVDASSRGQAFNLLRGQQVHHVMEHGVVGSALLQQLCVGGD